MADRLPLVGVTTYRSRAGWGSWDRDATLLPVPYVDLVAEAGGWPVMLPPIPSDPDGVANGARAVLDRLDALVLAGGDDVDPATYGAPPHPSTGPPNRPRDRWERALTAAALERDLPLLAICRGLQVLNVQRGGTLLQHLPDAVGHTRHQPAHGVFEDTAVCTVPGTITARVFGPELVVRCSHHQAVDRLGQGLVATAWAAGPGDPAGLPEALELPERRFVLAVQWHPEESGDVRPFAALVEAADAPGQGGPVAPGETGAPRQPVP